MEKLNREKLKNIAEFSSEEFIKIQKSFFAELENYFQNIKIVEKSKIYLELQKAIEKLKNYIQEYNIKYLKNINEEQIKYTKKLIESFENKLITIKMHIALAEKKKLIEKKMHEKYLERRNTTGQDSFEDCSFKKKNESEISNKKIIDNIIDSSGNLIKFFDIFKQSSKESKNINKIFQNSNTKHCQLLSPTLTENRGFCNNYHNNHYFPVRVGSINYNSDLNGMNALPNTNFNNINLESYFILDDKITNNNFININSNFVNPNTESPSLNIFSNENLNLVKYIEEMKIIKNSCFSYVKILSDDPNYLKIAENEISILKEEFLKEYPKYRKLKRHIKIIARESKN